MAIDASVGAYVLVSTRRVTDFEYIYTYQASVVNSGGPLVNVTARATSLNPAILLVDDSLSFGDVAAGATAKSLDTFGIRKTQSQAFTSADLSWVVSGTPGAPIWAGFTAAPSSGSAPLAVRFTPVPLTDAAIIQYRWDFDGNGTIDVTESVGRDQYYTYSRPGTYPASLTVTDSLGRTNKRVQNIVVTNSPPTLVGRSAEPSNGAAPLSVNFYANASDNDGVATIEWDFDGNGTFDRLQTGGYAYTSYTYTTPGTYAVKVRLTDTTGASTVVTDPTLVVRVGAAGSPQATLSLSPSSGSAPLSVRLSGYGYDPQSKAVQKYEWDVDGDGVFETSTTTSSLDTVYSAGGIFYPRLRITWVDGRRAEDVGLVAVNSTVALSVLGDTLDTNQGQTSRVVTTLSAATRVSIVVEPRGQSAVRTLVPSTLRSAGRYTDVWDGKNDAGQPVPEGVYHVVLLYEQAGKTSRFDLSTSTGGAEFTPTRTAVPVTYQPFNYQPMSVDISLDRAAELTAFMGSFDVDTRYVTFYTRQPFGRGTHRLVWNGDSANGKLLTPAPGDSFLIGTFGYTLPDNAVFVRNGAQVSNLTASPSLFDPTAHTSGGARAVSTLQFSLSQPATINVDVVDSKSAVVIRRMSFPNLSAGTQQLTWDGKAGDGRLAAPGTYRLSVTATQRNGFRSMVLYTLQRVQY